MNKLVFHWDENVLLTMDERTQSRLLKQWTHTAKAFGIYHLLIIGKPPANNDADILIEDFKSYQEIRDKYESNYVVIIEGGKPIGEIEKPHGEIIYVVGSNYADPEVRAGDIAVGIKAGIPLFDLVAASIILHEAQ